MAGRMGKSKRRCTAVALLMACAVAGVSSCSDSSSTTSPARSKAASAASAAASAASSAVASLASQGASALASASAEAKRRLDEVKSGINAKDEVSLGAPASAGDGRITVPVTVHNTANSAKSFVVQVSFNDTKGNLLDTCVVTVDNVAAGKDGNATARSNRKLSGPVRAEVARALRY
ncbi:hypothetical protein [Streptomyces panaciradicis]|uniref:hypothetical protein n=1 Tax=Streptomyces panaciradicis TaxID=1470261 RepID=UPI00201D01A7|nr:hypothetical protein [Streptomyces panaciradicis]MCL6667921.1 hypothetical protein [Streptomyces panaciradicis]